MGSQEKVIHCIGQWALGNAEDTLCETPAFPLCTAAKLDLNFSLLFFPDLNHLFISIARFDPHDVQPRA
jgi:hypothetical protein